MFERFTEHARRIIFFARYEASSFGSEVIETEHLLLGILREDQGIRGRLGSKAIEQIRGSITERAPKREKTSTSVDIPLSHESKRALAYCDEESKGLNQKVIDCGHIILGLLRIESCGAAALLREHGIEYTSYRDIVGSSESGSGPTSPQPRPGGVRAVERPSVWEEVEESKHSAPSLQTTIDVLQGLLDGVVARIDAYSETYGEARLRRRPWTRKEAMGHLIDWAMAHQQWLAGALTGPKLIATGYPSEDWVSAQHYASFSWPDLVDLWLCTNRLLIHVFSGIPEEKLDTPCRIGIDEPIPLSELIDRYVDHCDDVLGQILARL
jgi:hypothetical protein